MRFRRRTAPAVLVLAVGLASDAPADLLAARDAGTRLGYVLPARAEGRWPPAGPLADAIRRDLARHHEFASLAREAIPAAPDRPAFGAADLEALLRAGIPDDHGVPARSTLVPRDLANRMGFLAWGDQRAGRVRDAIEWQLRRLRVGLDTVTAARAAPGAAELVALGTEIQLAAWRDLACLLLTAGLDGPFLKELAGALRGFLRQAPRRDRRAKAEIRDLVAYASLAQAAHRAATWRADKGSWPPTEGDTRWLPGDPYGEGPLWARAGRDVMMILSVGPDGDADGFDPVADRVVASPALLARARELEPFLEPVTLVAALELRAPGPGAKDEARGAEVAGNCARARRIATRALGRLRRDLRAKPRGDVRGALRVLVASGWIPALPACPTGGTWTAGLLGNVKCDRH